MATRAIVLSTMVVLAVATVRTHADPPEMVLAGGDNVREGGSAYFELHLGATSTAPILVATSTPIIVNWTTQAGTATAAVDYIESSGTVTFSGTDTSTEITVPVILEEMPAVYDPDESFTVVATAQDPTLVANSTASAEATILDDEAPYLDVDGGYEEGGVTEGGILSFTIFMLEGITSTVPIEAAFYLEDSSVWSPLGYSYDLAESADYLAPSASFVRVSLAVGTTSTTVQVQTESDDLHENTEALVGTLARLDDLGSSLSPGAYSPRFEPRGTRSTESPFCEYAGYAVNQRGETYWALTGDACSVNGCCGCALIENDDPLPSVSIADASAEEGDPLEFVVTWSGRTQAGSIYLYAQTYSGTAIRGEDFAGRSGTVFVGSVGDQTDYEANVSYTLTVPTIDDSHDEPRESMTLELSAYTPELVTMLDATADGAIDDNDDPPTRIDLSARRTRISEGGGSSTIRITATLVDASVTTPTIVTVNVGGSGSAAVVGFDPVADFDITVPAFSRWGSADMVLTPADDNVDTSDETVSLSGSADSGLPVTPVSVTIEDDDDSSDRVALDAVPSRVSEGDGTVGIRLTATLNRAARVVDTNVTVTPSGSGSSDVVGHEPLAASYALTIPARATRSSITFDVIPVDDNVVAGNETIVLSGSSDLAVDGTDIVVTDNDRASGSVALTARPRVVDEGDGPTPVTVTASLDGAARGVDTDVTVDVADTGSVNAVGYVRVPAFAVTVDAGDTKGTGSFTVDPVDDEVATADEVLMLDGTSSLPVAVTDTVRITDNDTESSRIVLGADPSVLSEGAGETAVRVTATLDASPIGTDTVVAVHATDTGVSTAVDYEPIEDFEITIPARRPDGASSILVTPIDDSDSETTEYVRLEGTSSLAIERNAQITIFDNDNPGIVVDPDHVTVDEGSDTEYTVSLQTRPESEVTVTATAGGHVSVSPDTLLIQPDAWSDPHRIVLTSDQDDDYDNEATTVDHESAGSYRAQASLAVTVVDDDSPVVTVFRVLLFESASHPTRQGFLRVINHSEESGVVTIEAVDDAGDARDPVTLAVGPGQARHFNSDDLEDGNDGKGLSGGVGRPTEGHWRLKFSSVLDIEVLAYSRTRTGFVNSMHDNVPAADGVHRVSFFNPASNADQLSLLRLVNIGENDLTAEITGVDDAGRGSGTVKIDVGMDEAYSLSAVDLESGTGEGISDGSLGDGHGKWRLEVRSELPLAVKSLLANPSDDLTNLSTSPMVPGLQDGSFRIPMFLPASDPDRQSVVRVVNPSGDEASVTITARDDTDNEYDDVVLTIGPNGAGHFNSGDLENGNAAKRLTGSTGPGTGVWDLTFSSDQDIEVLSYVRTGDGFLTAMHDVSPSSGLMHDVAFFNPASNTKQVSRLRITADTANETTVTIDGTDDNGTSPGSAVVLTLDGSSAVEIPSTDLESGAGDLIDRGALGDGFGKWRLVVESDHPITVMSLLDSPTGHLANVSTRLNPVLE